MTKNEFDIIPGLVENYRSQHPKQRKGQALFNVLFLYFPEVAESIRATPMDPFYNDSIIDECYNFIHNKYVTNK